MTANIGNMKALADQLKQQKLLQARQAKAFETFEFPEEEDEEEGDDEGDEEEEDVAAFSQEEDETYDEQELVEAEDDAEEESDEEYVEKKKTKSKKRKPQEDDIDFLFERKPQEDDEEEINVITDEVEEKKPKAEKPKQKKEKRSEKKKKRRESEAAFSECYLCLKEPARGAHMRKCPVCDQVCCKACRKSRQCRECYKKTGVLGNKKKVRFEDEEISRKKKQPVKHEAEEESDEQTEDEEPKAKRQKKATSKKQEEEEELDMEKDDPDYWKDIPVEERVQKVDRESGFDAQSDSNPLGAWTYNAVFKPKYEVQNLCASSGFQCDGRRITRIIHPHFMTNDNFNRSDPTEKQVKKKTPKHPRPNLPTAEEHQRGFLKRDRCREWYKDDPMIEPKFDPQQPTQSIKNWAFCIWLDVVLDDKVRRMYSLNSLRKFQDESRKLLFDFTVVRKLAWVFFVEDYWGRPKAIQQKHLKDKDLDQKMQKLLRWYSIAFYGDESKLVDEANAEVGFPWRTKNGLLSCYGGSLEPFSSTEYASSSEDDGEEKKEASPHSHALRDKWPKLPRAIRSAFLIVDEKDRRSLAVKLRQQKPPVNRLYVAQLDNMMTLDQTKKSDCFQWNDNPQDSIPQDQEIALLYNDSIWVLLCKVKAIYHERPRVAQILLLNYFNDKIREKMTTLLRSNIAMEITNSQPNLVTLVKDVTYERDCFALYNKKYPKILYTGKKTECFLLWYAGQWGSLEYHHCSTKRQELVTKFDFTSNDTKKPPDYDMPLSGMLQHAISHGMQVEADGADEHQFCQLVEKVQYQLVKNKQGL